MSGINGDKSRFHRIRKQKIARRLRNHAMLKNMTGQPKATAAPTAAQSKTVSE